MQFDVGKCKLGAKQPLFKCSTDDGSIDTVEK